MYQYIYIYIYTIYYISIYTLYIYSILYQCIWYSLIGIHLFIYIHVFVFICSGVTLLFEHSLSQVNEIEHFEIFSCLRENQFV